MFLYRSFSLKISDQPSKTKKNVKQYLIKGRTKTRTTRIVLLFYARRRENTKVSFLIYCSKICLGE